MAPSFTNISSSAAQEPTSAASTGSITPMSTELRAAIRNARPERLEKSLATLCKRLPGGTELLSKLLLVDSRSGNASKKRPRWVTCVNCEKEFSPADNADDQACVYHPDILDINYDEWPDHDEDCHGPIDTPENREEFPEGFTWACCGEEYKESEGCERGLHREAKSKRRKVY